MQPRRGDQGRVNAWIPVRGLVGDVLLPGCVSPFCFGLIFATPRACHILAVCAWLNVDQGLVSVPVSGSYECSGCGEALQKDDDG